MVFVMITNDTIARFMATVYAFLYYALDYALPLYNHVTVSSVKLNLRCVSNPYGVSIIYVKT